MEGRVISVSLRVVGLWVETAVWVSGHGQQIGEAFAVACNPISILSEW